MKHSMKKPMMGGQTPSSGKKMMKSGGAMTPGPVGTGGMKNPNKMASCNSVNQ